MRFQVSNEGIESVLKETFVRDEVLQILKYNRKHISFVAGRNEYSYLCPLDLHCRYNTNQIMAGILDYLQRQNRRNSERV